LEKSRCLSEPQLRAHQRATRRTPQGGFSPS
jgi:hypothetical protein